MAEQYELPYCPAAVGNMPQTGPTDCWRTCVANILNIDPREVPDFYPDHEYGLGPFQMLDGTADWLFGHGLTLTLLFGHCGQSLAGDVRHQVETKGCHIRVGLSYDGLDHAAIYWDNMLLFDPCPTGLCEGIRVPQWVAWLVKRGG